jgi:hypothetical protein
MATYINFKVYLNFIQKSVKMSRKKLDTEESYINNEPYKSIINILRIAPEFHLIYRQGMETKELRYLIIKDYKICKNRTDDERLRILSEFKEYIFQFEKKKICLNQDIKPGRYKEKQNKNRNQENYIKKSSSTFYHLFNEYLKRLEKFGWIHRKNGMCSLDFKHNFLLFKLRQKDLIMRTDFDNTIFHSSTGYSYTYYIPKISVDYLINTVRNIQQRLTKIENYLKEAQNEWFSILSEARDRYLKDLWVKEFLQNKDISRLAKFDFSIEIIFDEQIFELYDDAPPKKTINEQWNALIEIKNKALTYYIQRKYPTIDSSDIERFMENIKNEKQLKEKLFQKIKQEIKRYNKTNLLEHLIVLDYLAVGGLRYREMITKGAIQSTVFDRNKPVGEIRKKLGESSRGVYQYDPYENQTFQDEHQENQLNEKALVNLPFFEEFFNGFESELEALWVKKNGVNKLKFFYDALNKTAKIFKIPSLTNNPDELLQKNPFS